ncbi:hypothetical protein Pcinc_043666 [Petrolisthes cinctipes]|uniref:Uncharacterized protein n=1 Tax=Petrolisthes cinctipes TaxID=88211 RepID=A0AAE1BFI7_PETCI|nr:hypothetical protein Pcinc_043666 [Petrolisthes cinctipes]
MEPPMPYLITSWIKDALNVDPKKRPKSTKLVQILKKCMGKLEVGRHSIPSSKRKATTLDRSMSDAELTSAKKRREETKPPMS